MNLSVCMCTQLCLTLCYLMDCRESDTTEWLNWTEYRKISLARKITCLLCSVKFSCSVMSNSLWPHGLQHARPTSPSPTPNGYSNWCPLTWWCIQPSHPLSSPSPPAFNLSQHQGIFQWVSSSHQVAKVLEFELQHQSFQWTPRTDLL